MFALLCRAAVAALPLGLPADAPCAALALCQAEDEGFEGDEGPAATRVVERCTDDLQQLEEQLSRLQMESNPCEVAS